MSINTNKVSKQPIEEYLKSIKQLSVNTIKTYATCLRSIAKHTDTELTPQAFVKNKNIIFKFLQTLDFKRRKLCIASILLFLSKEDGIKDLNETLRNIMLEDIKLTKEEEEKQEKTPKQKANWMTWDEVLQVRDKLESIALPLIQKKTLNNIQYNKLIDYIIVALYTYQPPRRLDYKDMRPFGYPSKDIGEDDNYIDVKKKKFIFQNYKTKGTYDEQEVSINPKLFEILKAFSKVKVPFDLEKADQWLILDTKGKKFNSPKLSQRLNSIFNRANFSVNMLRHIYISEKVLPDQERIKQLDETAEAMGHSRNQQQLYKKFDKE